jgi:hypothetical protein
MEEKSTLWKSAMIYGLYFSIVIVLVSVIMYATGFMLNSKSAYINYLIFIVGILIAQIQYRNKELNGTITYGQAYGFGVAMMIFVGIVSALFTMVLYTFIDPSLIEQMKTGQEQEFIKKGLSDDQVEAAISMSSKFMTPTFLSISTFFGSIIGGAIIGLLTSIFVKKEANPDAFDKAMKDVNTAE